MAQTVSCRRAQIIQKLALVSGALIREITPLTPGLQIFFKIGGPK